MTASREAFDVEAGIEIGMRSIDLPPLSILAVAHSADTKSNQSHPDTSSSSAASTNCSAKQLDDDAEPGEGDWSHAAAHTVTVVLGAGVLSLPYAMRWLGLGWGIALLVLATAVSYYSSYLLAILAIFENVQFTKYRDLGQAIFGPRAGMWIVAPFQYTVLVGTAVIYIILGGESLNSSYAGFCAMDGDSACPDIPQWAWTLAFIAACLLVAPLPSIHHVSWISFVAAFMSLTYGLMAIVISSYDLASQGIFGSCDYNAIIDDSEYNNILQAFNSIGIVIFAYGGHSVLPEIQATLQPNPTTAKPMMKGVLAAYVPTTAIYFVLAIVGYLAYGDCTQPNVFLSAASWGSGARATKILVVIADLLVAIHVFGSIQIFSQPVMQSLQEALMNCLSKNGRCLPKDSQSSSLRGLLYRCTINCAYIIALGALSLAFPDASPVLGLVGGVAITWMTFVLPSLMYLVVYRKTLGPFQTVINWSIVFICGGLGMLATVGAGYEFSL